MQQEKNDEKFRCFINLSKKVMEQRKQLFTLQKLLDQEALMDADEEAELFVQIQDIRGK